MKSFNEMGRESARIDIKNAAMAANTNRPFRAKECPFMQGSKAHSEWESGYGQEQTMVNNLALAAFVESL